MSGKGVPITAADNPTEAVAKGKKIKKKKSLGETLYPQGATPGAA